jgi:hypothetical protein
MKKFAIGCLVVLVLGAAALAGIGYYGYLKVRSTVTQFAELRRIPEIEKSVRVKTPFTAPESGELTSSEVDRFLTVQTRVRERLGHDFDLLQRNYQSLSDRIDKHQTNVTDLPQLASAYRDMAAAWMNAKHAQVDALNEAGMSLGEYRWVRSASYQALDIPFIDLDFGRIAEQVKSGADMGHAVIVGGALAGKGPESNRKLVERYKKQLADNMPLAVFGL